MKPRHVLFVVSMLAALAGAEEPADDARLATDDFVRVTLIDRVKKTMEIYTPTAAGEITFPKIGSRHFAGLKPSEFAAEIKSSYVESGLHTADTFNVLLEYGPPPKFPTYFVSVVWRDGGRKEVLWTEGLTLMEAIRKAGPPPWGVSVANLRAHILRQLDCGNAITIPSNREIKIPAQFWNKSYDPLDNPKLRPGDTVVFPNYGFVF